MKNQYIPNDEKCVVSITSLDSGTAPNVFPDTALIKGSLRFYSESVKVLMLTRMRKVIKLLAESHDVEAKLILSHQYDPTINDEE